MADQRLVALADQAAKRYGVDPALFRRLIQQESGWNPAAASPAGARGLTQVVPKWHPNADLSTPQSQLDYGAKHLSTLMRNFGNDPALALAAYNAGAGAVKKHGGVPPYAETQNYVKSILSGYTPGTTGFPAEPIEQATGGTLDVKRLLMLLRNQRGRSLRGMMPAKNFRKELMKVVQGAGDARPEIAAQSGPNPNAASMASAPSAGGAPYGWANQLAKQFGLQVTSTFRDPDHNRRIGGSPTSAHMSRGAAADFAGSPDAMRRLAEWAINSGLAREVFYDPLGVMLDDGKIRKGRVGGHSDHVHIEYLR